jgi:hypothetical protein
VRGRGWASPLRCAASRSRTLFGAEARRSPARINTKVKQTEAKVVDFCYLEDIEDAGKKVRHCDDAPRAHLLAGGGRDGGVTERACAVVVQDAHSCRRSFAAAGRAPPFRTATART